jgi:glycosyltransferase involved in cell wall biosynthesis
MSVVILLSTYNGERHLPALLDSIAAQTEPDWRVVVRDDGSTDGTLAQVRQFAAAHPGRVHIEAGSNLGAAASFMALLGHPEAVADFVAFCDQDDVWHPDKLARAVARLRTAGTVPALYCSRAVLVDASLQRLGLSPPFRSVGFDFALFENVAMGCTTVLNRAGHHLIAGSMPPAGGVVVHDWWCYLVIAALDGQLFCDPEPSVDYRLHGDNVIGLPRGVISGVIDQARRLARNPRRFFEPSRQAQSLLTCFGDALAPARRAVVEDLLAAKVHPLRRFRFALLGPVRRQRFADQLVARVLIAAGLH